jgi:hypothetical protein
MQAVEYHHFTAGGRTLLFDVNALAVIDSCELDRLLLENASQPDLLAYADDAGYDVRGAWLRLQVLREQRFLVEEPRPRIETQLRPDCRACWSRNVCDRPSEDCEAARAKAELYLGAHAVRPYR